MIDADKYEGYTEGDDEVGWRINNNFVSNGKCPNDKYIAYVREGISIPFSDADARLIADAPLFLAEVKRLRKAIDNIAKGMDEDWRHWRNELEKVIE